MPSICLQITQSEAETLSPSGPSIFSPTITLELSCPSKNNRAMTFCKSRILNVYKSFEKKIVISSIYMFYMSNTFPKL